LLSNIEQAACLVRAMVLRTRLADRAGDRTTARRWAAAVVALWSGTDTDQLEHTVEELRNIAGIERR